MSRIARKGFVYYRAETDRFFDIKIKRLRKEFSCQGYSVYDYFVNEIYRVEGCFMQYSTDEAFCCADYWNIEESEVNRIISYCAEIGLFDAGLFSTKQILTSRSIQENYVDMCRVMKRHRVQRTLPPVHGLQGQMSRLRGTSLSISNQAWKKQLPLPVSSIRG